MTETRIIAIHQPNYFPWLGYFFKLFYSDVLVLHDNVRFSKRSVTKRTYIRKSSSSDERAFLTLPLRKHSESTRIKDLVVDGSQPWGRKHLNQLKGIYGNSACFKEYYPVIEDMILQCQEMASLVEVNSYLIRRVAEVLALQVDTVRSSALPVNGRRAAYNVNLVLHLGGDVYLSGVGGKKYQDDADFAARGIRLVYHDLYRFLETQPYPQAQGEFINGLSVLDALLNVGARGIIARFEAYAKVLEN